MNSLFFWIIVLSFLIPMAMRYYKKSVRGRNQNQGMPGGFPGPYGQFPGDTPGNGAGNYPGPQNRQPRDGLTQRDYFGAFGQLGAPQQPAPPVPYEDSPGYPGKQPQPFQQQDAPQPSGPAVPAPPSAPQGFRARKLADLDQRYSDGQLTMEDYMAQRAEIMKG
ncbi:hypothetical protein J2X01_000664 [Arthrobacter ginsengisoli]|uniref:SHOCT domain-containing protein n=1 Tax=Arthrobacter ginsengisoli TaxID=1356565 RepID=A0ABU1U868_9MICC|nr:hypothetical protein [Arthrobacter ginsengisoli]MDR7081387.1 hypothetical protein [Arthrobacter ginsengisoli]